jgi:hypothetical protein
MRFLFAIALVSATLAACGEDVPLGTLRSPDLPPPRPPTSVDQDAGDACARDVCADLGAHSDLGAGTSLRSLGVGRFS